MRRAQVLAAVVVGLGMLTSLVSPAQGQSDTTPPTLVSLTLSPNQVDVSMSDQTVVVTAVVTDDLSGVSFVGMNASLDVNHLSPVVYANFQSAGGDSWTANLTIPQFAAHGIWKLGISLQDNANNFVSLYDDDLMRKGFRFALGVGDFEPTYSRTIRNLEFRTKSSVEGQIKANEFACYRSVPIVAERKVSSGWNKVWTGQSNVGDGRYDGTFDFKAKKPGKYRVIATALALGEPRLTTCSKVVARISRD